MTHGPTRLIIVARMKRKTASSSDEDSNVSEDVELESSDEEVLSEVDSYQSNDIIDDEQDVGSVSEEDNESTKSIQSNEVSPLEDAWMLDADKMEDGVSNEDGEAEDGSVVSADGDSDGDSVSLHSMDTVEAENAARVKKEQAAALRDRDFSSLYLPVGGIFDHKLIRGLPVDTEEFKRQQEAFFNGDTAAERTTTRNTPANVIEALDQELRFARPPVTTDILVAKYNVIKLVIKRRIDHLRARGLSTPGIRYDHSLSTTSYEESGKKDPDGGDRLLHDIQFRNPPMTVKDMSILYNMSVHALHAKIYALRNKGVVTNGICASTNGRGRPRKTETESLDEIPHSTHNTIHNSYYNNNSYTSGTNFSHNVTKGNSTRVLKYFTEEEDNIITYAVLQCLDQSDNVNWGFLDGKLKRTRGATKQRWHKSLEKRVGSQIHTSLQTRLRTLYQRSKYNELDREVSHGWDKAEDGDNEPGECIRRIVPATLNSIIDAVTEYSLTYPHHILTLPLTTTTNSTNSNNSTATTTTANHTTQSYSKSNRTITPTPAALQQHLHTTNHSGVRRAFTEQEDTLIICTALQNRQRGIGRFWNALDEQLQRPKLAARGRWQRVLEPMVQQRIAMMNDDKNKGVPAATQDESNKAIDPTENSNASGTTVISSEDGDNSSSGLIKEQVKKEGNSEGMDVVEQPMTVADDGPVEGSEGEELAADRVSSTDAILPSAMKATEDHLNSTGNSTIAATAEDTIKNEPTNHTIISNHAIITAADEIYDSNTFAPTSSSTANSTFSAAEDEMIRTTVREWTDAGNRIHELSWRQLDTQLQRPSYSALVRYITVLQPPPTTNHSINTTNNSSNTRYNTSKPTNGYHTLTLTKPTPAATLSLMSFYRTFRGAYKTPIRINPVDEMRLQVKTTLDCMIMSVIHSANAPKPHTYVPKVVHPVTTSVNVTSISNGNSNVPAAERDEVNPGRCKRFTPEEDALLKKWIGEAKAAGKSINWTELDRALNRSTGATRQRWKKVLGNEY